MKKIIQILAVTAIASSAAMVTTAHAYYDSEVVRMKKACIAEGKRIGIRSDGSLGCGTGLKEIDEPADAEINTGKRNDAKVAPGMPKEGPSSGGKASFKEFTIQNN